MGRHTWLRRASSYIAAAILAGFGFTGIAAASSISNTGPNSTNSISSTATNNCSVTNTNKVNVTNVTNQSATTGDAELSGNTTSGSSWTGWSGLDPAIAQANLTSYASWRSAVTTWIGQHAAGSGWNSNETNLAWSGNGGWSGYDPVAWQANGQSFANWYTASQSYLDANSSVWVLGWPAEATGNMVLGGATSGNASNNNNASFSITINNAARAAAGTDSCGHSLFVPPTPVNPPAGGSDGGNVQGVSTASALASGSGSGVMGASSGTWHGTPAYHPTMVSNAPAVAVTPSSTSTGGSGGAPYVPEHSPSPTNSISNTGPCSDNIVSSSYVNNSQTTNSNTVTVVNSTNQSSSTGTANVSSNTATGASGSGGAGNINGTGVDGTFTN